MNVIVYLNIYSNEIMVEGDHSIKKTLCPNDVVDSDDSTILHIYRRKVILSRPIPLNFSNFSRIS